MGSRKALFRRTSSGGGGGAPTFTFGAPDNLIVSGASFANWTVDAASWKTPEGLILSQSGTSDNLIYDVPAAVNTQYWMRITVDRKSPNATGNVRLVALADTGCEVAGPAGVLINPHTGGALGTFYFLATTGATQATGGKSRIVLKHATSPDTVAITPDFTTDTFTLANHAYITNQVVRLQGITAPAGMALGVSYYAVNVTTNTFQLATAPDGSAVNFLDNGSSVAVNNWFRVSEVVFYDVPARSSAKVSVIGDRTASWNSVTGAAVDTAVLATGVSGGDSNNVVTPGDMSDGTTALTVNDTLKTTLVGRGGNMYANPGNWDYSLGISGWETYFGITPGQSNRYRKVSLGQMDFFFYDTNTNNTDNGGQVSVSGTKASVMGSWLATQLAASSARWKIVVLHHPAYTSSTHHSGPSNGGSYPSTSACMQWNWKDYGVAMVLASHDHVVERMLVNGCVHQTFALGGGAANVFGTPIPESQYRSLISGYLKLHDSANTLVIEHFDTANIMQDRYKITRI